MKDTGLNGWIICKLKLKEVGMRMCIGCKWCEENMQWQVPGNNVMNLWFCTRQGFLDPLSSIEFLKEDLAVGSLSYLRSLRFA